MRALLVLSIALAIGCRDEQLARLEAIRDEICACDTADCGAAAMSRLPDDAGKPGPRTQKVAREMLDCLAKLYSGDRLETGPDTETGPEVRIDDSAPGGETAAPPLAPTTPPAPAPSAAAPTTP